MSDKMREALEAAFKVLGDAPELNLDNYDHDQACELNTAATEAYNIIDKALALQSETKPYGWAWADRDGEPESLKLIGHAQVFLGMPDENAKERAIGSGYSPLYFYTSSQQIPQVPDGYKLVPIEPTDEQVNAGWRNQHPVSIYINMLAAAPSIAEQDQ